MQYYCSKCKQYTDTSTKKAKCSCGGLFSLDFKPEPFSLELVDKSCNNIFRYRAFMPPLGDAWKEITLGEGFTPTIRFDEDLMLKMDYMMPTLSFKDSGAAVLMAHAKNIGITDVVQDSSGNAGNSVEAYSARAGINCDIFVPEGT